MRFLKIITSIILCLFILTSCQSNAANAEYFKEQIENAGTAIPEDMHYMPSLFSDYEQPDKITVSTQKSSMAVLAYSFRDFLIESENGLKYQYINVHVQKRDQDISSSIDGLIDSYKEDGVSATKYESNGKKYAISYEIRPDLDIAIVNVIYPVSDFISAFYALEITNISDIDDETIEKICDDTELIKL